MKYDGEVVVTECGVGKPTLSAGTMACVHCGAHWIVEPGSGRVRGFCMECNGPTCGPNCVECIPQELLLENIEKGRPENYRPIMGNVPRLWVPDDSE